MMTKYGKLPNEMVVAYVNGMIGKLYKMLPMKENNISTLNKYIKSTLRELVANKEVVDYFRNDQDYLQVIDIVESLLPQDDIEIFKSDIFKATRIVERMKKKLGDSNELS